MMRLINVGFRGFMAKAGCRERSCQWLCAALLALAVGGCQGGASKDPGIIGSIEGFAGAAIADDPRAVTAARDVLVAGGSAADAAVAIYFTLAVTLPSSAGLGGGGVCLIHEPGAERPIALDFLPRAAADGSFGLPGNVRGMAVLQSKYGRLKWNQLLGQAEDLARGSATSLLLARDLVTVGKAVLDDAEMGRIYGRADGSIVDAGDGLQQLDLAATISQIQRDGAGAFYGGPLSLRLASGAQSIGLPLEGGVLRAVPAQTVAALTVNVGERAAYFAPPPADGGLLRAELLALLLQGGAYAAAADSDRPHLLVEAAKRAFADHAAWSQAGGDGASAAALLSPGHLQSLMQGYNPGAASAIDAPAAAAASEGEDPGSSGFVVADRDGLAVACEVTMNRLFGVRRVVPGTGVILAAPPAGSGMPLGPMIVVSPQRESVDFAATASGGSAGASALVSVFLDSALRGRSLDDAIAAKRVHDSGAPDTVLYEEGTDTAVVAGLSQRGHAVQPSSPLGQVNALWCPDGLPNHFGSCQARNDPRASGFAVVQGN
jgi:gamma-glutamyltranspeptidase / glutathione hydrolase